MNLNKTYNELYKTKDKDTLYQYSESIDEADRVNIARNINCPIEILEKLSDDSSVLVINSIILNKNCSVDLLRKFSFYKSHVIRDTLAKDYKTPIDVLKRLSNHDIFIKTTIASNPNCPVDILRKFIKEPEHHSQIKINVMNNINCTVDILEELSNDNNYSVIIELVKINCPAHILKKIYKKYPTLRDKIKKHPNWELNDFE